MWNITVAETLFNVSLIYKDQADLPSAIQCCRGSCRVYAELLGEGSPESRDAETWGGGGSLDRVVGSEWCDEGVGGSATRVWGGGGGGEEEGEEEGEGRSVGDSGQPCHFLSF